MVEHFVDDVELLGSLTGEDFSDRLDDQVVAPSPLDDDVRTCSRRDELGAEVVRAVGPAGFVVEAEPAAGRGTALVYRREPEPNGDTAAGTAPSLEKRSGLATGGETGALLQFSCTLARPS